jgi:ribonuclease PH
VNEKEGDLQMSRPDFRNEKQLRPLACSLGDISEAQGSCHFSQGNTEVVAAVYGPGPPKFNRHEQFDTATLEVDFNMSGPAKMNASSSAGNPSLVRLERSSARFLRQSLTGAVRLEEYPRTLIVIKVIVIRDDGAMLSVAMNAASLALMDAGLTMNRIPISVTLFYPSSEACLDNSTAHRSDTLAYSMDPVTAEEAQAETIITFVVDSSKLSEPQMSSEEQNDSAILQISASGSIGLHDGRLHEATELALKASNIVLDFTRKMCAEKLKISSGVEEEV